MNKNIILSILVLLVFIFLIITIYNLYLNNIEKFENENTKTRLEIDLENRLNTMQDIIKDYSNTYVTEVNNRISDYSDKLDIIANRFYNSDENLNIGSNCVFSDDIELNNYDKIEKKACNFELDCSDGNSNSYPKIYKNEKTLQQCAKECSDDSNCIAFTYKENENEQLCVLSSMCTENNADNDEESTLYSKNNLDFVNFPLLNYKIDYNRKCRTDIYDSIDNNMEYIDTTKNVCAKKCNEDKNCISFEFTPNKGDVNKGNCKKYSKCYEFGCLEKSGSSATKCTNTSLYTKQKLIPSGTVIPQYIDCNECNDESSVYNRDFVRLYENDYDVLPKYVFTHNVSKIQNELDNDILRTINYYKLTSNIKIKLYSNNNFKGNFVWLEPSFSKKRISDLPQEYRGFKSFEIFNKLDADEMVKDCVGKWLPCKYNTKGELISQWQTITPAQNNGNCKPEKDGGKKMCIQDCEYLHEYGKNLYDISLCTSDDKSQYRNIKKLKKIQTKRTENGGAICDERIFEKEFECNQEDIDNNPYSSATINWEEVTDIDSELLQKNVNGTILKMYWDVLGTFKSTPQNINGERVEYEIVFSNRIFNNKVNKNITPKLTKYVISDEGNISSTNVGVYTNNWYYEEDNQYIKFSNLFNRENTEFFIVYKNNSDLKKSVDDIQTINIYDINNKIDIILNKK